MNSQETTNLINKLQRRYPGTRRQRNDHGAGRHSVEFFSRETGRLVARYWLHDGEAEKDLDR